MKKIQQRTCVGCNQKKDKTELIRIVKDVNGEISVDKTGKKPGRGAYICDDSNCLERLIKSLIFIFPRITTIRRRLISYASASGSIASINDDCTIIECSIAKLYGGVVIIIVLNSYLCAFAITLLFLSIVFAIFSNLQIYLFFVRKSR